jgi:hypothetical protein
MPKNNFKQHSLLLCIGLHNWAKNNFKQPSLLFKRCKVHIIRICIIRPKNNSKQPSLLLKRHKLHEIKFCVFCAKKLVLNNLAYGSKRINYTK